MVLIELAEEREDKRRIVPAILSDKDETIYAK